MHGDQRFQRFFAYLSLFCGSMFLIVLANNFVMLYARLGAGGAVLLPAHRLLVRAQVARTNAAKKAFITTRVGDVGFALGILIMFFYVPELHFARGLRRGGAAAQIPLAVAGHRGGAAVLRRHRQERPVPAAHLAAGRHGGPDAGQRADPCRHDGRRRRLHGGAPVHDLLPAGRRTGTALGPLLGAHAADLGRHHRPDHRAHGGGHRRGAKRHQARAGLLDHLPARVHDGRSGDGAHRLRRRGLPPDHPRLLQGPALPGLRQRHPRLLTRSRTSGRWAAWPRRAPITYLTFWAGTLALAGIFPFAGFFSKDEILAAACHNTEAHWLYWVFFIGLELAAFLTAFYMGRCCFLTFSGEPRSEKAAHAHESPALMTVPLIILAVFAVFLGWVGSPWVGGNLFHHFVHYVSPLEHGGACGARAGASTGWWRASRP